MKKMDDSHALCVFMGYADHLGGETVPGAR